MHCMFKEKNECEKYYHIQIKEQIMLVPTVAMAISPLSIRQVHGADCSRKLPIVHVRIAYADCSKRDYDCRLYKYKHIRS